MPPSGNKSLLHAVEAVSEVKLIDELLVSGLEPPSLAKPISTSDVFRKRLGDAAQKSSVTTYKKFGRAM